VLAHVRVDVKFRTDAVGRVNFWCSGSGVLAASRKRVVGVFS